MLFILSIILALLTPIIGVISIYKWEYKPQRMTRFLILILTAIIFFSLLMQPITASTYLAGIQLLWSCIYFIASFKYWMGGTSKLDISVLLGVILIGIVWCMTNNALVVLMLSLWVDIVAFVPTFVKTWKYPHTESWMFYWCDVLAGLVSLFSLAQIFTFGAIFSWYVFFLNLTMVLIIVLRRKYLFT